MIDLSQKCTFRPRSFPASEVGCCLDHCQCNTHDVEQEFHKCGQKLTGEAALKTIHPKLRKGK